MSSPRTPLTRTKLIADAKAAGVPVTKIGVTGGNAVALPGETPGPDRDAQRKIRGLAPRLYGGKRSLVSTRYWIFAIAVLQFGDNAG